MHCYNHQNEIAVGICAACAKGICSHCSTVNASLTCDNNECIEFANKSKQIIKDYNVNIANDTVKKSYFSLFFVGIFFITMSFLFYPDSIEFCLAFGLFGLLMVIYGGYHFLAKKFLLFKN